jgi:O-antigen/teichoic acid export membrane protein
MQHTRLFIWSAVLAGILSIGLAIYYWMTPAGALPTFIPGHEAGVTTVHFKHGLGMLIIGVGLFVYAWFASAPAEADTEATAPQE